MGLRRSFKPTNSIVNGSFEYNLNEWTVNVGGGTIEASIAKAKDGVKSTRIVCAAQSVYEYQDLVFTDGNIIYISLWAYLASGTITSNVPSIVYDYGSYLNGAVITFATLDANWRRASAIKVATSGGVRVNIGRTSAQTAEYYVDAIMAIDLTALFGAGKEPTVEWCDANLPVWFDGTMSGVKMGGIGGLK